MIVSTKNIVSQIKKVVSNICELDINEETRVLAFVKARCLFYYACKKYTKASLSAIGRELSKNHATVIHGLKTHDSLMIDADYVDKKIRLDKVMSALLDKKYSDIDDIEFLKQCYRKDLNDVKLNSEKRINEIMNFKTLQDPILNKLSKLPNNILKELNETRIEPYLKMKELNKTA